MPAKFLFPSNASTSKYPGTGLTAIDPVTDDDLPSDELTPSQLLGGVVIADDFTGTGTLTASSHTTAATATETFTGTGTGAVSGETLAGTGTQTIAGVTGDGALAATGITAAATSTETFTGPATLATPGAAAGTGAESFTATAGVTAGSPALAGTATERFTGTGALTDAGVTAAAAGSTLLAITGTGALVGSSTTSGTGTVPVTATTLGSQFARPIADTLIDNWTKGDGGTTNLFSQIDETSPDPADLIQTQLTPTSDVYVCQLSALIDPQASTGHVIRYQYGKNAAGGDRIDLTVQLRQGYVSEGSQGTLIKTLGTHTDVAGPAFSTNIVTLLAAEADAITAYDSLFLRFVGTKV